jgi:hypothetical protein
MPVPAPIVPIVPSGQQWACVLDSPILSATKTAPYPGDAPREPPFFAASTIYHPPR